MQTTENPENSGAAGPALKQMLEPGSKAKNCKNCCWVDEFSPRKDEEDRGLTLGCKKPNWEGYTKNGAPACGGVFFFPK